jgi:hypothetical protein
VTVKESQMKSRSFSASSGPLLRWTLLVAVMAAAGCGSGGSGVTAGGGAPIAVSGTVHGGQNPVAAASVYAYQAGSSGYGRGDVKLACTTTSSNGQFSFGSTAPVCSGSGLPAAFSCPATGSPNLYLLAVGGNPGAGNNPALVMMAALGACNGPAANGFVTINEVTTAASVWALSQFMNCSGGAVDAPVAGCSVNSRDVGTSATNAAGISNAMALVGDMANLGTGVTQVNAGSTAVPTAEINSLADILQDCVNSTGAASTACNNLFSCAVPGSKPGTANSAPCTLPAGGVIATDTLAAALDIARNPENNIAALFNLISKTPAFTPALTAPPNSWTLSLEYLGGGLSFPVSLAIDGNGNAWVANFPRTVASVTEITPTGAFLTGATGLTGGGIAAPQQIAIDQAGNAWVANCGATACFVLGGSVTEISAARGFLSGTNGFINGSLLSPHAIAIDGAGNAWVGQFQSVVKISPAGDFLSGANGFTGGGLGLAGGIAIDAAGNSWITNNDLNTVTELSSSGLVLSGPGGYTGGTLDEPKGVAIDIAGNVWIANVSASSISELSSTGLVISPTAGFMGGGLNNPLAVATDPSGKVWVANQSGNSLIELSPTGNFLSGPTGFTGTGMVNPSAVAIDAAGNIWLPNQAKPSVTEFVGAATPVLTPMAACLTRNTGHAVCLP